MVGLNLFDKHGKEITLESTLRDEEGTYIVRFGSLETNNDSDCDDIIAYGVDGETEKILWPERATQFELVHKK
jgi:hypothetical protein